MNIRIKDWRTTASVDANQANEEAAGDGVDSANSAYQTSAGTEARLWCTTVELRVTTISKVNTAAAAVAITNLKNALDAAAAERAQYGAYISRLQHAADNLQNVSTNTSASVSRIADADYATETTELARTQIISQASTAMLAQANQVKQTVLSSTEGRLFKES